MSTKIGINGFGRIGRRISKKAKNFGLKVIAYDPYLSEKEIEGVEIHSLNKVLKDSNIISLHLPLTEQTNHIIDNEQFDNIEDYKNHSESVINP